MAEQAGPATWALDSEPDQEEMDQITEQAKQFADKHKDVIDPLVNRITELQEAGVGDDLLMFAATLASIGNRLMNYIRYCEAAARGNKN